MITLCKKNPLASYRRALAYITCLLDTSTCHVKPKKQGEEGGIIRREIPMYASKVMRVCPKCGKATREAFKVENGAKVRVCKKCGETI